MDNKQLYFKLQESIFNLAEDIYRSTPVNKRNSVFESLLKPIVDEFNKLAEQLPIDFYSNSDIDSFKTQRNTINNLISIAENSIKKLKR